jgi:hypothetical protein
MTNPKNPLFRDTGLPMGMGSKIQGTAATVSGDALITAICNNSTAGVNVDFANQAHLDTLEIPKESCVSFAYPLHVTEFTTSETTTSVVYVPLAH